MEKFLGTRELKNGDIETAIQKWTHPNGKCITLVNCVHLAEPGYHHIIFGILKQLEEDGAEIHMEGIRSSEKAPAARAALDKEDEGLRVQNEEIPKLFELPWVWQMNTSLGGRKNWPASWHNHDATELDMAHLLGTLTGDSTPMTPGASGAADRIRAIVDGQGRGSLGYKGLRRMYIENYRRSLLRGRSAAPGRAVKILRRLIAGPAINDDWQGLYLLSYRECIAVTAALAVSGDVAMVWHGNHWPGIISVLERNQFTAQEPTWLTALKMPPRR